MANSFSLSITLLAFWGRFNVHFPKALVGWKNIVDEFELKASLFLIFEWKLDIQHDGAFHIFHVERASISIVSFDMVLHYKKILPMSLYRCRCLIPYEVL